MFYSLFWRGTIDKDIGMWSVTGTRVCDAWCIVRIFILHWLMLAESASSPLPALTSSPAPSVHLLPCFYLPMTTLVRISRPRAVMSRTAPTSASLVIQHINPSPQSLSHQPWRLLKTSHSPTGAYPLHLPVISSTAGISQMSAYSPVTRSIWVLQLQDPIWFLRPLSLKM